MYGTALVSSSHHCIGQSAHCPSHATLCGCCLPLPASVSSRPACHPTSLPRWWPRQRCLADSTNPAERTQPPEPTLRHHTHRQGIHTLSTGHSHACSGRWICCCVGRRGALAGWVRGWWLVTRELSRARAVRSGAEWRVATDPLPAVWRWCRQHQRARAAQRHRETARPTTERPHGGQRTRQAAEQRRPTWRESGAERSGRQ